MKRVLRTAWMALLVMVLCTGMMAPAAQAAENVIATAKIPVTITMEGNTLPESDTVSAEIAAVTSGAPVPGASVMDIVCKGKETTASFEIGYTKLGIYQYTVTIKGGDYYLAEYGGDLTYNVTVSVTNNAAYDGYDVKVVARLDGETEKTDITGTNTYIDPLELTVVKKWVDQDSSRPASVNIDLLKDGEVVEGKSLTLSSKNSWQGSWDGLDPREKWSVKETKVPAGYTASYKFDEKNNIWTVTNTGSLLQTGQMNWPIPVLVMGGIALVLLGLWMTHKRKEENA